MNEVTRSTHATSSVAAGYAASRRAALPNGWWGAALLVATEAALFGSVIATYYYLRFNTPAWPPAGVKAPDVALPLALTGALIATSAPLLLASRAAHRGRAGHVGRLLLLAMAVQAAYIAVQIVLFKRDLGEFSPRDSAYGSIYFTMLALHHVHVLLGIMLELGIAARLAGGLTSYRIIGVRVVALYWHFVNAMAVLVVVTQLSPAL